VLRTSRRFEYFDRAAPARGVADTRLARTYRGQSEFIAAFSIGVRFSVQRPRVQLFSREVCPPGVAQGVGLGPALRVFEPLGVPRVDEMLVDRGHVLGVDQPRQPQRRRPTPVPVRRATVPPPARRRPAELKSPGKWTSQQTKNWPTNPKTHEPNP